MDSRTYSRLGSPEPSLHTWSPTGRTVGARYSAGFALSDRDDRSFFFAVFTVSGFVVVFDPVFATTNHESVAPFFVALTSAALPVRLRLTETAFCLS